MKRCDSAPSVALFASSFHPHIGGVEELVRQLAQEQTRRGGSPLVVTMRWPKSLPATDAHEGIPICRHVFRLSEPGLRPRAAYLLTNRFTQRSINRQLLEHGADLVHVQCVSSNAWFGYRAARQLGLPLVVTLHGELTMDASDVYDRSGALRGLLRRLMTEADAVTACSAYTLEEAERSTGISLGERGVVIRNGISLQELRSAQPLRRERPYVLAMGRHVPQKGFDVLLEAWARLLAVLPEAPVLVLAGDGPERHALEARARSLGLGRRVEFPGFCDRDTTVSLFAGAEVFVLPSRHEPFGIVNLEAMAAATPVVATRVGGVPEIIDSESTGLLVPPDDPDELARALIRVLTERQFAQQLAQAAAKHAECFDWSSIASHYQQVYNAAH